MKSSVTRFERSEILKKKLGFKKWFRDWQLYVLLLPAVINLLLFNYIPMYGAQIAFRDFSIRKGIWGSDWVGLKHFISFINYPNFGLLLKNTLQIGLYGLLTFPCAVIFALMLNEAGNIKLKKTIQMISYMPYFLSTVVVCSLIRLLLNEQTGVVNKIIQFFGQEPVNFLSSRQLFDDVYTWSGVWQGLGFGAIIYIAALSNVSQELVEAACIDGANRLQIIRHVKIPEIMPTITIMLILNCGAILGVGHEKILLLQNPLNISRSQVISTYVYELGLISGQFSYSSAVGLFNMVVNVLMLLIVNAIAKKVSDVGIW